MPENFEKRHLSKMKHRFDLQYWILLILALFQIGFGFTRNTPKEILEGLGKILTNSDVLITDYFGQGNMGAAFVNSGLLVLMFIYLLYKMKIQIVGVHMAGVFTIAGFALFGKNIMNVWPPLIGVYLYSRYKKEPFIHFIISGLFSTAFSPLVSEIMFIQGVERFISIPLGIASGILLGFIIPNVGSSMINFHYGLNLGNVGFTAGMLGMLYVSTLKSYSFAPTPRIIWTTGNNLILSIYLFILFAVLILLGFHKARNLKEHLVDINEYSGRLVTDFVILEGVHPTLINMGIMGMVSTFYILFIGGDLNGPTIGSILCVSGFAAFGLNLRNVLPIFFGVYFAALTKMFSATTPSIQMAALLGTFLAPVAGEYGPVWGVVAASLHSSVVLNVTYLHGGLNLYNNGFSAGLVAAVLVPIIEVFEKENL